MGSVLETRNRRWNLGWLLPLVLLALPNCLIDSGPFTPDEPELTFYPGENPTSAIMCEIPKPLAENESDCATDQEIMEGISFAAAATGLADSIDDPTALDWSQSAQDACGENRPKKKKFYGTYPDGYRTCLNCGQMPNPYANPTQVCIAKCKELLHNDELLVDGDASHEALILFCELNAKVAINVDPPDICYQGACTEGGNPNLAWVDPRRAPEPVQWTDHIGTDEVAGTTNSLERTAPTSGTETSNFDAGAASTQTIPRGDGWVEFAAGQVTVPAPLRLLGLRPSFTSDGQKCFDPTKCPDTDPHVENVGFAIYFYADGQVYVLEPGATPGTFEVFGPFGPYTADERYRIRVTDNLNGTASISYHRVVGGVEQPSFATNTSPAPLYPLRVDTTFLEFGGQILDATIVRIKQ